jgi:hypothetical protein
LAKIIVSYCLLGITISVLIVLAKLLSQRSLKIDLSINELTISVLAWSISWPIIIFYTLPKFGLHTLFEVHESFDFKMSIEDQEKSLMALWQHPPECTNKIYTFGYDESEYKQLNARLYFHASNVEEYLDDCAPDSDFSVLDQDAILLRWVKNRNKDDDSDCQPPEELGNFNSTANSILSSGKGKVLCGTCNREYSASELLNEPETLSPGWNYSKLCCPHKHPISVSKSMHLMV